MGIGSPMRDHDRRQYAGLTILDGLGGFTVSTFQLDKEPVGRAAAGL